MLRGSCLTDNCSQNVSVNEDGTRNAETYSSVYDMIHLLTVSWLTPGGSSTVHIYTQTIHRTTQLTQAIHRTTQLTQTIHRTTQLTHAIHRTTQLIWKSAGRAPSLRVIPWHLPYN